MEKGKTLATKGKREKLLPQFATKGKRENLKHDT